VGITYVSGFSDAVDLYEDNLDSLGYYTESSESYPAGISFQPYRQLDNGFGIGTGIGPFMMVMGPEGYSLLVVPVNVVARYTILQGRNISPYVRFGLSYNLASGDFVEGSTPGAIGGAGVEFLRNRRIGFGAELSYDSSQIEMEKVSDNSSEKITPGAFMISVFAVF